MRARSHVDPHPHAPTACATRAFGRPGVRSTWASCQSVSASSPHSWRDRSARPATWSSSTRRPRSGRSSPGGAASRPRVVARERLELAAEPGGGGNREATLAAVHVLAWQQRLGGLPEQHLLAEATHLLGSAARARSRPQWGRGTARAPRASAPSTRGRSSRAGRRRGRRARRHPAAGRGGRRPPSRRSARGARRPDRTRAAGRSAPRERRPRRSPSSRGGAPAAAGAPLGRSASRGTRDSCGGRDRRRSTSGRASRASRPTF